MKIGDLVKYRYCDDWLGIIVDETPGTSKLKSVEWIHISGGLDRSACKEKDLVLVNENR